MRRREFVRTAGGATAAAAGTAAAGSAGAQEEPEPDFEGYLDGIEGGYEDLRGQAEVTVDVGAGDGLQFSPAGIWIDEGTTVTWEWTGQGGDHNVFSDDQDASFENAHDFDSGDPVSEEGYTFSHTFEEPGRSAYYCEPHYSVGMWGAVAVGEDVPTIETGEGGGGGAWPEDIHDIGVPFHPHWVGVMSILSLVVTLVFMFYVLKYGESSHTGTGRN